jgi:hypothetical protein
MALLDTATFHKVERKAALRNRVPRLGCLLSPSRGFSIALHQAMAHFIQVSEVTLRLHLPFICGSPNIGNHDIQSALC